MTHHGRCPVSNLEADERSLRVNVLAPREVPLGGTRAMTVRRTLPQRDRTLIGAWCFADHYGPDDVTRTGGMTVPPHPHTGLQTVGWLFSGEVEHRDSLGSHAFIRPGELRGRHRPLRRRARLPRRPPARPGPAHHGDPAAPQPTTPRERH